MDRIYTYTGNCPNLERSHSITIRYGSLNFAGDTQTYYRKLSYSCNQNSNCTFKDECGECPVYKSAPENP